MRNTSKNLPGHIESRVLLRICWSDDWHQMVSVCNILPRVPNLVAEAGLFWLFQQDRLGPLPFEKYQKEFLHQDRGVGVGVELAHPGDQHGPRHASQIAQNVGVNPMTLGPQFDSSQS